MVNFFESLCQLPNPVIRFLLQWYSNQHLEIRWNSILSSPFSVTNGVQQGRVLSPILFTVYIDELLQHLQKLGVGCNWEKMFVGSLCYADDLALIAPSAHALRRMLQVCSSVVKSHVLQSFCTYFYGAALWKLACPELQLLETAFNKN